MLEDKDCHADSHKLRISSTSVGLRSGFTCELSREYLWQLVKHHNLATPVKTQPCHILNNTVKDRLTDAQITYIKEKERGGVAFLIT